ncbi:TlpA family protein disulfide reductase [Formosa sp. S-31]
MLKGQIPDKPDDSYVGKPAVDFNLTDMDGKKVSLSELKGKVVVLNFWFTLCKPCVKEMPELNELTEKYKNDKDVVFLGITFNNTEDVKKFMSDHEFNYRIIPNAAELVSGYNMSIFPHNAIIDKNGIIKYFTGGYKENLGMVLSTFIDMLK